MRIALSFVAMFLTLFALAPEARAQTTAKRAAAGKTVVTANPYLGMPVSEYDARVSQYSPIGARNPYTTNGGKLYAQDGTYLGRLNANQYDPESVANPHGRYGSEYSSTSINNRYSRYGSPYSNQSARNPYTRTPPTVVYPRPYTQPTLPAPSAYTPRCYYNCK
jgi:hypothetical protein